MQTLTVTFEKERETKNTIRYQEVPVGKAPAVIGTLYVQKWALAGLDQDDTITVTISG